MIYKKNDILTFGKYKGIIISKLIKVDFGYICWCMKNIEDFVLDEEMIYLLRINYQNLNKSSIIKGEYFFSNNDIDSEIKKEIDNLIKTNFTKHILLGIYNSDSLLG